MENYIKKLHESPLKGVVIEMGCGCEVASKLLNVAGASNTIVKTEVPYSKDILLNQYGITGRAVSYEAVHKILNTYNEHNLVYVSSFQIGGYNTNITTHGWIGIKTYDTVRYYHITIHHHMSRVQYISEISEIGLSLLYNQSDIHSSFNPPYIDNIRDNNGEYLRSELLDYLHKDSLLVFNPDGSIGRFEDIFRDQKNVHIFKGSFNPPTLQHQEILNTNPIIYPCISLDTKDKGIQDKESILKRVYLLNKLGYTVLINAKPLFVDLISVIREGRYYEKLTLLMGVDTFERLSLDYNSFNANFQINQFKSNFYNTNLIVFKRYNYQTNEELLKELGIKFLLTKYSNLNVSSTKIREQIKQGIDIEFVDETIKDDVIKIYN